MKISNKSISLVIFISAFAVAFSQATVALAAVPTVTCNNLTPGVWQNITPPNFNANNWPAAIGADIHSGLVYLGSGSSASNQVIKATNNTPIYNF